MDVAQSPAGHTKHQVPSLRSLQADHAEVSAYLDTVFSLKNKLETAAASTDKGLRGTEVHQRVAALDRCIARSEARRAQLSQLIEQATAAVMDPCMAKGADPPTVTATQNTSHEHKCDVLMGEPSRLVEHCKELKLQEPCVEPASSQLPTDFSDVFEDDWGDVQMDEDWLSPANDTDGNLDLSSVFEADESCMDATALGNPTSKDGENDVDQLRHLSGQPSNLPQTDDLSLPTEEELLNDSVLNEAIGSASLLDDSCFNVPEEMISAPFHDGDPSLGQEQLLDPFLDTFCTDLYDSTLLKEHAMLLKESAAAVSMNVRDGSNSSPRLHSPVPASQAVHAGVDYGTTGILIKDSGCPIVDLLFDVSLDDEIPSGDLVQLCYSDSEAQTHATDTSDHPDGSAGARNPCRSAQDGNSNGSSPAAGILRASDCSPSSHAAADKCVEADRYTRSKILDASMHADAPSESDSDTDLARFPTCWGGAEDTDVAPDEEQGCMIQLHTQRMVSLTQSETRALPDILAAAKLVRRALAPIQCTYNICDPPNATPHAALPDDAPGGKENANSSPEQAIVTSKPPQSGSDNVAARVPTTQSGSDNGAAPVATSQSGKDDSAAPVATLQRGSDNGAAPVAPPQSGSDSGAAPVATLQSGCNNGAAPVATSPDHVLRCSGQVVPPQVHASRPALQSTVEHPDEPVKALVDAIHDTAVTDPPHTPAARRPATDSKCGAAGGETRKNIAAPAAARTDSKSCRVHVERHPLKPRNPLKRSLDRTKLATDTATAASLNSDKNQPCKVSRTAPHATESRPTLKRPFAPSTSRPTRAGSVPSKSPPKPSPQQSTFPPRDAPQHRVPRHPVPPHCPPPQVPPTSIPRQVQCSVPVIIPRPPPSCPPPSHPPPQPVPYTAAQPVAMQPARVAHVTCMPPPLVARAPNAMFPAAAPHNSRAAAVTHTPQPPRSPPPSTATAAEAQKLKLEPMPDLSILCDIMRAATTEGASKDARSHKTDDPTQLLTGSAEPRHPSAQCSEPPREHMRGGQAPPGHRDASHGVQNPNKSKRERLKALTQGSSRNLADWGRRQGYHRERVRITERRRGGSTTDRPAAKQPAGPVLHAGQAGGQLRDPSKPAGRSQEALRQRGAQPMLGSTCRKETKSSIALPDDSELFGC